MLFVDPDYQRQGVGTILVQWGTDLADRLFLPCWVEASEVGHGCYARQGYEDLETIQVDSKIGRVFYYIMGRPQKVKTMEVKGRLNQRADFANGCSTNKVP
jgi:GNAT superfamily N-acetyltransferase